LEKICDGGAKSLTAKHYEKFAEARVFPEDFSVSQHRRLPSNPRQEWRTGQTIFISLRRGSASFPLKTRSMSTFWTGVFRWTCKMLQYKTTENGKSCSELFDANPRIAPRPTCLEAGTNPFERFRTTEPRHAQCWARQRPATSGKQFMKCSGLLRPKFIGLGLLHSPKITKT